MVDVSAPANILMSPLVHVLKAGSTPSASWLSNALNNSYPGTEGIRMRSYFKLLAMQPEDQTEKNRQHAMFSEFCEHIRLLCSSVDRYTIGYDIQPTQNTEPTRNNIQKRRDEMDMAASVQQKKKDPNSKGLQVALGNLGALTKDRKKREEQDIQFDYLRKTKVTVERVKLQYKTTGRFVRAVTYKKYKSDTKEELETVTLDYDPKTLPVYLSAYDIFALTACGVWSRQKTWEDYGRNDGHDDSFDVPWGETPEDEVSTEDMRSAAHWERQYKNYQFQITDLSTIDDDYMLKMPSTAKRYNRFWDTSGTAGWNTGPMECVMRESLRQILADDPRKTFEMKDLDKYIRVAEKFESEQTGVITNVDDVLDNYQNWVMMKEFNTHEILIGFGAFCTLSAQLHNQSSDKLPQTEKGLHEWLREEWRKISENGDVDNPQEYLMKIMLKFVRKITFDFNDKVPSDLYMDILRSLEMHHTAKRKLTFLEPAGKGIKFWKMSDMVEISETPVSGEIKKYYLPIYSNNRGAKFRYPFLAVQSTSTKPNLIKIKVAGQNKYYNTGSEPYTSTSIGCSRPGLYTEETKDNTPNETTYEYNRIPYGDYTPHNIPTVTRPEPNTENSLFSENMVVDSVDVFSIEYKFGSLVKGGRHLLISHIDTEFYVMWKTNIASVEVQRRGAKATKRASWDTKFSKFSDSAVSYDVQTILNLVSNPDTNLDSLDNIFPQAKLLETRRGQRILQKSFLLTSL